MGRHNIKQLANECFIAGLSVEQAVEKTKIKHGAVKNYYTNFIILSAKIKSNSCEDKLLQIASIERKLFDMIKQKADRKKIDSLQYIYSHYNALN